MDPMKAWLAAVGLERYADVLAANDVDLETLPHLTEDDLRELGLSLGHRRKLLARIGEDGAGGATATGDAAPLTEAPRDADRRQLTLLFCDLAGSTELSERLDPEGLRAVLQRYHDAVAAAVSAHRGHVAKHLGDGVLAYFGWPRADERQAEGAIRAGLAAVAAVGALEAEGRPLSARCGIATGPVVVGDMTGETAREAGAVTGATPNLAARLQAVAEPGAVVIDTTTRRLAGSAFRLAEGGPVRLKGFAEAVAVWRVLGLARGDSRFESVHAGQLSGFVGRAHEVGLLGDRWHRACEGEGQVVLLSGEAGIGKSRVVHEVAAQAGADGGRLLRAQCSPHDTHAALHPLVAEIEAAAGVASADGPEARATRLEAHLAEVFGADGGDEAALLAALLSLPGERRLPEMTPARRRQRTARALVERIARISRAGPVMLLVEDIHWIDPSSAEVLDELVPRIATLPVLAVLTHRPEHEPAWRAAGHVTACSLNRLARRDARALAERVAGKALPGELLDRIVRQADGIPLFVEELVKTVLESGLLEEREDRFVATAPLPPLAVPASLADSLTARLDRLAPVKRVVQAAACVGREFSPALVAAALSMEREELDAALDRLVEAELVFPAGGADERRYVFKHALVQDAAYESLLSGPRRDLHARLAAVMQDAPDPDPLQLARHHAGAGSHDRAAELYLVAGRRALEASALPEAAGALELGLAAVAAETPSPGRDRHELAIRVALGAARMALHGWSHLGVAAALGPAFPLARAAGDADALGSILWGLWVHTQTRADFPAAHGWLRELARAAAEAPGSDLPVVHHMCAGCQCFWEADHDGAVAHTDALREVYEPARHGRLTALRNHDPLVFSQHWAGSLADWIRGRPDRAVERMEEAVDLARRLSHPFNLVFALTAGSTALLYLGRHDRMLAHCDEAAAVAAAEALGPFAERVLVGQWRGAARVMQGDPAGGHTLLADGNAFWSESEGRICSAMFGSWIALGLAGLGRDSEAGATLAAAVAHCRSTGDRFMEPECLRLQGEAAATANNPPEHAETLLMGAVETAQAHGARSWELRAATSLARLEADGADGSVRSDATRRLEAAIEGIEGGLDSPDLRRARATLDGAR